jgi:hypothetical protein
LTRRATHRGFPLAALIGVGYVNGNDGFGSGTRRQGGMIMTRSVHAGLVLAGLLLGLGFPTWGHAAEDEQFFASIFWDKKKIGQVHIRLSRGETGEVEELRARASVSMLGINLYEFTQDLHQVWDNGDLKTMRGTADDNGTKYEVVLERDPTEYQGTLNGKPATVPSTAFPNSLWHYAIVDHDLLFKQTDLQLLHVKVVEAKETIKLHGKSIPTRRATFSGDFSAVVWFDENDTLVQGQYEMNGRKIRIERDE